MLFRNNMADASPSPAGFNSKRAQAFAASYSRDVADASTATQQKYIADEIRKAGLRPYSHNFSTADAFGVSLIPPLSVERCCAVLTPRFPLTRCL